MKLGKARWDAGPGTGSVAYVTLGSGVGAGIVSDSEPGQRMLRPEARLHSARLR